MLLGQTSTGTRKGHIHSHFTSKMKSVQKKKKKDTSVFIRVKGKLTRQKLPFLYKAGTRII